ncbi:hypothetical protein MMYC01_209435 [Madurella mycetomatis]|uniref:Rhodopsin domain-containing protein n=1 Tax=Madurella mycetomatis TaxID=100816 RepID=A0A175VRJ5_9PEZI|nr:hypothetical protein MMYC01_209435 [Madurella mycetomatis]
MSVSVRPILVSNPHDSYQANIIACAAITWSIGATFVALRFYTRGYLLRNVLGPEDWFVLVALVFSGATCAGMIEQAVYGLGKHALDIDPTVLLPLARAGWYTILWYMLSLLFTKISILILYLRILSYQHARYAVHAILAIVIFANGLWTLITVATACTPLQAFWDPTLPNATCRPSAYWFANTGLHIGTDILLYVLPLPVIINLQVKLRQKLALYSVLALGFFVCTVSTVRLWDLVEERNRPDFTYDNVSISYLTCVEINAAIACACCMTLKPLAIRVFPRVWGLRVGHSGGGLRDLEAGGDDGGGGDCGIGKGGRNGNDSDPYRGRGPPTIGSTPSRVRQKGGLCYYSSEYDDERRSGCESDSELPEEKGTEGGNVRVGRERFEEPEMDIESVGKAGLDEMPERPSTVYTIGKSGSPGL